MKAYSMISPLACAVVFAILGGCAGGLPQQELKKPVPAEAAPAATAPAPVVPATPGPVTVVDPVTGMEFVFVKGGCYKMGDTFGAGGSDEKPVHDVCVSDFYLGKYEVTQSQWEKVLGNNPSTSKEIGPDYPVNSVSWQTIQEFIKSLNAKSGKQYRLPSEAEWEYAARSGGKEEKWAGTDDEASLDQYAWYDKNSSNSMHRIGLRKANGLGIHDMSGNVYEWCQDFYNESYYKGSPKNNPSGADHGETRVLRGGSYLYDAGVARAAKRRSDTPGDFVYDYGLRLLLPAQ